MGEHIIGHLDMDAFFAAIEERDTPRFAGQPLVVGADPQGGAGRGVVSTANYSARAYGIHSAMPIGRAWKLSEAARRRGYPPALFLPGNWRRYQAVSRQIMSLVASYMPRLLQVGVDEVYLDLSDTGSYAAAECLVAHLRAQILHATALTASAGIGPNKLVAKIASDYRKPNGLTVVRPADVVSFLASLPVRALPGVGPKSALALARHGIQIVADIQRCSPAWLTQEFGRHGESLYRHARGQGSVSLEPPGPAKSISEQVTFAHDTLAPHDVIPQCLATCERVWRQVGEEGFIGWRTVTVMARFTSFVTHTRARTLAQVQTTRASLAHEALRLLLPFFDQRENPRHEPLRLIGVRVTKLSSG